MQQNDVIIGTMDTPLGTFGAVVTHQGLARLTFPDEPLSACEAWVRRWVPGARVVPDDGRLAEVGRQLREFLSGRLQNFSVPLDMRGTPFQREVWAALRTIPYGQVCSYADIARLVGRPKAVRAVGAANGANPVPVIVPCHRVIGSNGKLTGFGGGLPLKERLLKLEGPQNQQQMLDL
ncbi:MAG TPA: methylated-DNA--[protein]-cysteine S-methyltransferase [Symbiobacteriaceae bacterium]|nr:methylated-DNA--[protein]-cysteine S-methyltransferase [Symbiobacteriaceae bacterium]